jgi:hypothetical protein
MQQDQTTGRPAQDRFDFVPFMCAGVVPRDIDSFLRMPIEQGLQQLGNLTTPFVTPGDHHGLAGVPVDRTKSAAANGLPRRWNHDLPSLGTPHRTQCRQPTDIELVCVVEDLPWAYAATGVFDLFFLSA